MNCPRAAEELIFSFPILSLLTVCPYKRDFDEWFFLSRKLSKTPACLLAPQSWGARGAGAMPSGSWRAMSRSTGGVGVERGPRGGPPLFGSVGDAAFRSVKSEAGTNEQRSTQATVPTNTSVTSPSRGFVAVALGKPKLSRVDDRRVALARLTAPTLSVEVRGTKPNLSGKCSTSNPAQTEEDCDLEMNDTRPGDDEDGFYAVSYPDEDPVARKARWAADSREAAGVRATERAKEPWGDGEGEKTGRKADETISRRNKNGKLESVVAAAWRMKAFSTGRRWGDDVPTAFKPLEAPPYPKHYELDDELLTQEFNNGDDSDKPEKRKNEENEWRTRVNTKVQRRFSKFVDSINDPEFSAWDVSSDDVLGSWKGKGPRPTPMPVFVSKKERRRNEA